MKRTIAPARRFQGTIEVPGDKSIAHRAALLSILSRGPISVRNFPDNQDCNRSLEAARRFGVTVERGDSELNLSPPARPQVGSSEPIDCGNSGTTARLLAGLAAGSPLTVTLTGDESLSRRPMKRVVDPLTAMGAELFATEGHLPMRVSGRTLLPFEYHMPIASAQVKSALLLAALASGCSLSVREDIVTRDHTEIMVDALGEGIEVRQVKPVLVDDPIDPRKRRSVMPSSFKREINLRSQSHINGGVVDIPGDISTGAFFLAAAAMLGRSDAGVTVRQVGLNPTRTGLLEHLKFVGASVKIENKTTISGEPRGDVTVTGGPLRARKIAGETAAELIDEIPIVAVMAACADGTTLIRDASELRVKESDRLAAVADNLNRMGVKCGLLEDGLAVEGAKELHGADLTVYGDHRIAMAFSIAALFAVGPSTIDDDSVVAISCPDFFKLLDSLRS